MLRDLMYLDNVEGESGGRGGGDDGDSCREGK